jgi:hypothetical protein
MVSGIEADLMITGPLSCLYFTHLTTSVSICPSFTTFLHIWSACIPQIHMHQEQVPRKQKDPGDKEMGYDMTMTVLRVSAGQSVYHGEDYFGYLFDA